MSNFAQDGITCPVPLGIIDVFEVIQIDEHERTRLLGSLKVAKGKYDVLLLRKIDRGKQQTIPQ